MVPNLQAGQRGRITKEHMRRFISDNLVFIDADMTELRRMTKRMGRKNAARILGRIDSLSDECKALRSGESLPPVPYDENTVSIALEHLDGIVLKQQRLAADCHELVRTPSFPGYAMAGNVGQYRFLTMSPREESDPAARLAFRKGSDD